MRILGIDPGLATIGLGLVECRSRTEVRAEEWLTIETAAGLPLPERLKEIREDLTAFLNDARPALVVIERLFFAKNQTTAFDVAHARGVIVCSVADAGIPILEPTPMELKHAITGDGSADKVQMQHMLMQILQLASAPTPDDAADALALALYGVYVSEMTMKGAMRPVLP